MNRNWIGAVCALALLWAAAPSARAAEARHGLSACRLQGVEHEAWCGVVNRPFDPVRPQGLQIEVHFAVLPALARNRKRDPVFFFAGGPGQSAIDLAGPVGRMLSRLSYRRDIVLIDQRGTGQSAPLRCPEDTPTRPLVESTSTEGMIARLIECRRNLQKLPYGDLRHFTTLLAVRDAEAVRTELEVDQLNLVGTSYGTRVVLEYMRQFPQAVRRAVIDGVAPPDMALPASFSPDNQAALDAVFAACQAEARCKARYPTLRADWRGMLAGLPRTVSVAHPVTGNAERVTFTRDTVLGLVRTPLYIPALASALPFALTEAARGRFEPLVGLASTTASNRGSAIAVGMHFSVVCSEDLPRLTETRDDPGADYGDSFAQLYRQVCAEWPRAALPPEFYELVPAPRATLVLSGGADPATPPRHGERVAQALGARARHVVVPQAGHGLLAIGCVRDVVFHFVDAASDDEALRVEPDCARAIPRPLAFVPVAGEAAK